MAGEAPGHTLQPTALVHEACLRLAGTIDWDNPRHLFGAAGKAMRRILVERARQHATLKRGGGRCRVDIDDFAVGNDLSPVDLLALNDALTRMEQMDDRMSELVHLRFFAGLSIDETAEVMNISPRSVDRQWQAARCWLFREVRGGAAA
jgi:RNA polymerase sigma factor (TIGR02999 family)